MEVQRLHGEFELGCGEVVYVAETAPTTAIFLVSAATRRRRGVKAARSDGRL